MYAGGMAERARILKTALMTIFPLIEKQNVLLVLLNQVMAEIGGWRPGVTSAGGNALRHDIHMRLEISGGKTQYDGVYAVSKYSDISVVKSKVSPIMNDFPIIIDITKGGVIDRAGSFVWWMTKLDVFKQAAWWEVNGDYYKKYQPYWDKFGCFYPRFRQSKLYEVAGEDPNFVDFLQLIWLDSISEKYALQAEVCKSLRSEVETRLMMNLGLTYEELHPSNLEETQNEVGDALSELSDALNIDTSTGEVSE